MQVHLIKKKSIKDYTSINTNSINSFNIWLSILKYADWNNPLDIISTFKTADILGNGTNRVVFNIGGNNYRLICSYNFGNSKVHLFVKWIGTHSQYSKLCSKGNQFEIDNYK